jgi:hypothetical protein
LNETLGPTPILPAWAAKPVTSAHWAIFWFQSPRDPPGSTLCPCLW